MKRQRGLRRYYNKLAIQNDFDKLNLAEPNAWLEM